MPFQLIAGHPALDLINTLDWRFRQEGTEELLKTYGDLLRFAEESKLLSPDELRRLRAPGNEGSKKRALRRAIELREALADVFYGWLDGRSPAPGSRKALERHFKAALLAQKLNWNRPSNLNWEWISVSAGLPVAALARAAADLMTSPDSARVRACQSTECRWLFLDSSKNHTRRWCDMKVCGNRMKSRRFKARRFKAERQNPSSGPAC